MPTIKPFCGLWLIIIKMSYKRHIFQMMILAISFMKPITWQLLPTGAL